jgi:hypothetical protein
MLHENVRWFLSHHLRNGVGDVLNLHTSSTPPSWQRMRPSPWSDRWRSDDKFHGSEGVGSSLESLYEEAFSESDIGCLRIWECAAADLPEGNGETSQKSECFLKDSHRVEVCEPSVFATTLAGIGSSEGASWEHSLQLEIGQDGAPVLATLAPGSYFVTTLMAPSATLPYSFLGVDDGFRKAADCDASWQPASVELALGIVEGAKLFLESDDFLEGPRILVLDELPAFFTPQQVGAECGEGAAIRLCAGCPAESNCSDLCGSKAPLPQSAVLEFDVTGGSPTVVLGLSPIP